MSSVHVLPWPKDMQTYTQLATGSGRPVSSGYVPRVNQSTSEKTRYVARYFYAH